MNQKLSAEKALKLRTQLKRKKPTFRRQESWRYKRVSQVWRKPDGIDSKMRRRAKGWPRLAEIGFRGPRKARGLHSSGYEEVIVRNVDDLANIDSKYQAVRIAHTVSIKKRAEISLRAGEKQIYVLNPLPEEKPVAEAEEEIVEEVEAAKEGDIEKQAEGATEAEAEKEIEEEAKS